jgi:hypothetical protein
MSHSAAGSIRSIGKSSDFIGIRARNLPAWSIVPQPPALLCALPVLSGQEKLRKQETRKTDKGEGNKIMKWFAGNVGRSCVL